MPFMCLMYHILYYCVSKLVRELRLVNLAGRILQHSPLEFKVLFVAKLLRDLSQHFLNVYSKLRLFLTLNCVLKRAKDLKRFF